MHALASNLGSALNNSATVYLAQNDFPRVLATIFARAISQCIKLAYRRQSLETRVIAKTYGKSLANHVAASATIERLLTVKLEILRQRQTALWKDDPIELQHVAEELAMLVSRAPQLVDELVMVIALCKSAGVEIDPLLDRPAFQLLPESLRNRLK